MLNLSKESLYSAFKSRDNRFDGRFFVGISSTRIYCRPVCHARKPKLENCSFFSSAAEAESAGFRPCLLCRPELAPFHRLHNSSKNLAHRAARLLDENCGNGISLTELSQRLGCSDRHLRRIFADEFNVTPVEYLQTCRLLLAKSLLTDTRLSVLDVAMAAGFGSLRNFNRLFKKQYHLSPSQLRKQASETGIKSQNSITLALGYRPPYLWREMLGFLSGRAIPGVELICDDNYFRTVQIEAQGKKYTGWIGVSQHLKKDALSVTLDSRLLPVLPNVLAQIRHLFDLSCDPHLICEGLTTLSKINPTLPQLGTRIPGCFNPFEMAVRAVLGQQISVKAASTLATRILTRYGTPIETEIEGLTHLFPTPEDIIALDNPISDVLGPLGVTGARSRTILALAKAFVDKSIDFGPSATPEVEIEKLVALPGIGPWTANYIAMRSMGYTDAFLETDAGVKKALAPMTTKEMVEAAESWRPWRSYATISLWLSY